MNFLWESETRHGLCGEICELSVEEPLHKMHVLVRGYVNLCERRHVRGRGYVNFPQGVIEKDMVCVR